MKRYRQLICVLLGIVALVFMLIYRYEYMKLKNTFELFDVVNVVAEPEINCLVLNETTESTEAIKTFNSPLSIWNRVGKVYVYSAFEDDDSSNGNFLLRAIGVGEKTATINFECHIWYSFKDAIISSTGKFSFVTREINNLKFTYVEFFCQDTQTGTKGQPYMFVFIDSIDKKKYFIPVHRKEKFNDKTSSAVCTYPDVTGMNQIDMIEFVSFQHVLGVTDVLIYDMGIHYGILDKMEKIVKVAKSFRSFSVFKWNFPFDSREMSNFLLEKDCQYRTSSKVKLTAIVNLNEYIVPQPGTKNFVDLINSFDDWKLPNRKISMKTQICCIDKKSVKTAEKSWPKILKKTFCMDYPLSPLIIFNPQMNSVQLSSNSKFITEATFSKYDNCQRFAFKPTEFDPSPLEFLGQMMSSTILRLWKSGTFF